jgi:SAM-dependent methyltransferase
MNTQTVQQLLELNHQFYQRFSHEFSQTRQRLQPGVRRILQDLPPGLAYLDLGCGNGETWRWLASQAAPRRYVGLDFSPGLLEAASQGQASQAVVPEFYLVNLAASDWGHDLPAAAFDRVLAFAVLHHLPGQALRLQILSGVRRLLAPGGELLLSNWQFTNSPKLAERLLPWSAAGLEAACVDEGDFLLDWRSGGSGLRYVHLYSEAELADLAEKSGFSVRESFYSDGHGGRLGLYQRWYNPLQVCAS